VLSSDYFSYPPHRELVIERGTVYANSEYIWAQLWGDLLTRPGHVFDILWTYLIQKGASAYAGSSVPPVAPICTSTSIKKYWTSATNEFIHSKALSGVHSYTVAYVVLFVSSSIDLYNKKSYRNSTSEIKERTRAVRFLVDFVYRSTTSKVQTTDRVGRRNV
jgi:hypothetical protein